MKIPRFYGFLLLLFSLPSFAATDLFLEIDGIPGESKVAAHPNTIELESFAIGMTLPPAAKPAFQDISFSKVIDKSSPLLYLACASGKPIKTATLFVRRAGGDGPVDFYTIKLTDILV